MKKLRILLVLFVMCCFLHIGTHQISFAADDTTVVIDGTSFEFSDKSGYGYQTNDSFSLQKYEGEPFGNFLIFGNVVASDEVQGVKHFGVDGGNVTFSYTVPQSDSIISEESWHIVEDRSQTVGNIKLGSELLKGALILQASKDGKTWLNEITLSNYLDPSKGQPESFYTTNSIQLANGYYYKVILAYRLGIKTGTNKVIVVETDAYEYKKIAEVYEFYLYDVNNAEKSDITLSKTLGEVVKTGKDNGYSGSFDITLGDPHFGWRLGHFFVSGYTRAFEEAGQKPVFLKNVGDEVTLWFNLEQDIAKLNDDANLSIAEDTNGYDQFFQINKMNMGYGTLIVRYTDEKGIKHDPEIYTNFLAANSLTTADTIVKLFEEGDYEVALDYEIKNSPRKVGSVEVIPEYSDYRIFFEFSVRNANCMVYPFDTASGSELTDQAITANGFRLDMARSRYLTIDVTRSVLRGGPNGFVEDVRFNRPAKDGEEYSDEGIYTFKVKNLYTGEETKKTIYVGSSAELRALSANKISLSDLNAQISQGASISDDGTFLTTDTAEISADESAGTETEGESAESSDHSVSEPSVEPNAGDENQASVNGIPAEDESTGTLIAKYAWLVLLVIVGVVIYLKKDLLCKMFKKAE